MLRSPSTGGCAASSPIAYRSGKNTLGSPAGSRSASQRSTPGPAHTRARRAHGNAPRDLNEMRRLKVFPKMGSRAEGSELGEAKSAVAHTHSRAGWLRGWQGRVSLARAASDGPTWIYCPVSSLIRRKDAALHRRRVVIEAPAGLSSQTPGGNHAPQQRSGSVLVPLEFLVHGIASSIKDVKAD
jgi:hypothetical protein